MNLGSAYMAGVKAQPVEGKRHGGAVRLRAMALILPFTDWRDLGWEETDDGLKGPSLL